LDARIAAARVPRAKPYNLRLATWNIRELGKKARLDASIAILARVIASFDLVSVVEVRDDITDLQRILALLGRRWSVVYSDYLLDDQGNRERVAFLFRHDRVAFTGLASNAEMRRTTKGDHHVLEVPWWRPPFLASFRAGELSFLLVAAHVRWGKRVRDRETEIRALGRWLETRREESEFGGQRVLVVGDFNISSRRSLVWTALVEAGLVEAPGLGKDPGSDLLQGKRYDRILCTADEAPRLSGRAGTVDVYDGDFEWILPGTGLTWRQLTYQVSDHSPGPALVRARTSGPGTPTAAEPEGRGLTAYLTDVLLRVADHPASKIHELLPDRWQPPDRAG
jgi:hypothetical protein